MQKYRRKLAKTSDNQLKKVKIVQLAICCSVNKIFIAFFRSERNQRKPCNNGACIEANINIIFQKQIKNPPTHNKTTRDEPVRNYQKSGRRDLRNSFSRPE